MDTIRRLLGADAVSLCENLFQKALRCGGNLPQTEGFSVVVTGAKGIAIQEWKTEKTQLTREWESLYGQYKPLDEELSCWP